MTIIRATGISAVLLCLAACGAEPTSGPTVAVTPTQEAVKTGFADNTAATPIEPPVASTPLVSDATQPAETPAMPPVVTTPAPAPQAPSGPATSHVALKYLIGDVDPEHDPKFAKIPAKYIAGPRTYGHKDAVEAFVRMAEDADRNGYKLKIVSAFRSFSDQKQIWEDKWTGKTIVEKGKLPVTTPDPKKRALKILEYSSMPGTSRHHWGTDFDLNSLNNAYFNTKDGQHLYDWLTQHASEFGFCQPYTSKKGPDGRPTGYEEEKWHWSYMPVATWYLKQYPVDVGYERLTGFLGSESARDIDVIPKYVQGINPECK